MIKIAKLISDAGICSRRDAEKLVLEGRVSVNGLKMTNPAERFSFEDEIFVDGVKISKREKTEVYLFNKPKGCISSAKDPKNRPTIFDFIPKNFPKLVSIGRLDYNSEGLLIFTNSGDLAKVMMDPKSKIQRTYRVKVFGKIPDNFTEILRSGVEIDGFRYGKIFCTVDRFLENRASLKNSAKNNAINNNMKNSVACNEKNVRYFGQKLGKNSINRDISIDDGAEKIGVSWVTMTFHEGKNREIRKICEHFGLVVNRLLRVSYERFALENLAKGEFVKVSDKIVEDLLKKYLPNK